MRTILSFFLFSIPMYIFGQNLVLNGDFEEFKRCPKKLTEKKIHLKGDFDIIKGSPDYFNTCSSILSGSVNPFGNQLSQNGNGHMGLILTSDFKNECAAREYIQLKLNTPLISGHKYDLSFYLNLANNSGYATDQVGAVFSDHSLKKEGISKYIGHPHLNNEENHFLKDTIAWIPITKTYNALGGEQYLIIGNFQKCNFTSRVLVNPVDSAGTMENMKKKYRKDLDNSFTHLKTGFDYVQPEKMAYYFIDNVQLTASPLNDSLRFIETDSKCNIDDSPFPNSPNIIKDPNFDLSANRTNDVWKAPTKGTPDFENGHAGIYLYSGNDSNNREYILSKLNNPISPCEKYYFKMSVKRSGNHQFAVDRLGVAFCDTNFHQDNRSLISIEPSFQTQRFEVIESASQWVNFCDTIYPNACGNYIVIGNFMDDESTFIYPILQSANGSPYAHYLIDNLQLRYVETVANCQDDCHTGEDSISNKISDSIALPGSMDMPTQIIYFATNQYLLDSIPETVLSQILAYLEYSDERTILIQGHSDSSGPEDRNIVLSKRRAQSIYSLLHKSGVPKSHLKLEFVGSKQPKASNQTIKGKTQNRRVEILFK